MTDFCKILLINTDYFNTTKRTTNVICLGNKSSDTLSVESLSTLNCTTMPWYINKYYSFFIVLTLTSFCLTLTSLNMFKIIVNFCVNSRFILCCYWLRLRHPYFVENSSLCYKWQLCTPVRSQFTWSKIKELVSETTNIPYTCVIGLDESILMMNLTMDIWYYRSFIITLDPNFTRLNMWKKKKCLFNYLNISS